MPGQKDEPSLETPTHRALAKSPAATWDIAPTLITATALVATTFILMLPEGTPPNAEGAAQQVEVRTDMPRVPSSSATLELVQLSDIVAGNNVTVSGRVHNPDHAPMRAGLSAVVMLVDQQGDVVATARATLGAVEPGGTSAFTVALAPAVVARRYRVAFEEGETVVPHVDRRHDRRPSTPASRITATAGPLPTRGWS